MRKGLLTFALGLSLFASSAAADVLTVPQGDPPPKIVLPAKGLTQAQVEEKFGPPREKRPTVGGGSPQQPPITRWDYDGYSVIFEYDRVVDAVIPGAPPRIHRRDRLLDVPVTVRKPAPEAPAAEPAPEPMPAPAAAPEAPLPAQETKPAAAADAKPAATAPSAAPDNAAGAADMPEPEPESEPDMDPESDLELDPDLEPDADTDASPVY